MYKIIRPTDREAWLELRAQGIGSSEVGTLMGLNPFETPYQLWMRKTGRAAPKAETFAMRAGHYFEDGVAQCYADETGAAIVAGTTGDWLAVDDAKPYLRVSPDRLFWPQGAAHTDGNRGILECKTTQKTVDADNVPPYWFAQLQYQLMVMRLGHGALAWVTMGRDFGHKEVTRDDDFCRYMADRIDEFWRKNIGEGIEPEATTPDDVLMKYSRHTEGKSVEANADVMRWLAELKAEKEIIKDTTADKAAYEDKLKVFMADAESITGPDGRVLVTYKTAKDGSKFDEKAFAAAYPDLYKSFTKATPGSRRLLIK